MSDLLTTIINSFICVTITSFFAIAIAAVLIIVYTLLYYELSEWFDKRDAEKLERRKNDEQ